MIDGTVQWHHFHSTRIVCPRPERARSAGVRPYRAHNNAELGLSARDQRQDEFGNGIATRGIAASGIATTRIVCRRPERARSAEGAPLEGAQQRRARALSPGTPKRRIGDGIPRIADDIRSGDRFVRALRGRARPKVRPYRAHTTPSPGSQLGRHRRADPSRSARTR